MPTIAMSIFWSALGGAVLIEAIAEFRADEPHYVIAFGVALIAFRLAMDP